MDKLKVPLGKHQGHTGVVTNRPRKHCILLLMGLRLKVYEKDWILQQLVLARKTPAIQADFEQRYGRPTTKDAISRLRKAKAEVIKDAQNALVTQGDQLAPGAINHRANKAIVKELDRHEEDSGFIDDLRRQLHDGIINRAKFDQEVTKYEALTIAELVKISDSMHKQSLKSSNTDPLTPADQAAFMLLMEGLKNGNPMQLIQVLNPTAAAPPIVESPEHPVGTPGQTVVLR